MPTLRPLERYARLPLLAGITLLLAASRARADDAGDALVRRVMAQIDAMRPAVCDYTVMYRLGDALMTQKFHAFVAAPHPGTSKGSSGNVAQRHADLPISLSNVLFTTLDFLPHHETMDLPDHETVPGTDLPGDISTLYAGKETWEGAAYEVVEVTTPIRRFMGTPPAHPVTLRWYVGADNLIHRITTSLPLSDAAITRPRQRRTPVGRDATGSLVVLPPGDPASNPPASSSGKSPAPASGGKLAPAGKPTEDGKLPVNPGIRPSAGPDALVMVEALSVGARKAVMPAVRPPTNPPLPPRLNLEAGAARGTAALSPDGRLLAIANDDGSISLYDPAAGTKTRDLTGHDAPVPHVPLARLQFAAGSRLLVSADGVNTLCVWDTATGLLKREIKTPGDILSGICVSPDGAVLGGFNNLSGTLYLWNMDTGAALPSLPIGGAQTVAFSPDATRLVTVGSLEMALWDVTSGQARLRVPYVSGPFPVLPAAWSPDGKRYVWMRSDGGLVVCDGQTGAQLRELKGAAGALGALAFAADGKTLLGVDADQRGDVPTGKPGLVIWNTADWTVQEARELTGARTSGFQNRPVLAPAGRRLLLIDNEGLQFWDLAESLPPLGAKP